MNDRPAWQSSGLPSFFQEQNNPRRYQAWEDSSARELRLNLRSGKGKRSTIPYATIIFVEFIPPGLMSLMTAHYIVSLKGRHLEKLEEFLQDEKVRFIQAFDNKRFDKPDDQEPVIEAIDITWLKPKPDSG